MLTKSWPLRSKPLERSPTQAEKWNASGFFRRKKSYATTRVHALDDAAVDLAGGWHICGLVALLGFVYLKTKDDLTMRSDRVVASQIAFFAHVSPERRLDAIDDYLKQDPGRLRLAGLFGPEGRRIAGNLEILPPDLKTDNVVQSAVVDRAEESGREKQVVRLIAQRLSNGDVLVIGRNVDEVGEIAHVVGWALALGLIPAVLLCLAVGVALSDRARKRVVEVNARVKRIVAGKRTLRGHRFSSVDHPNCSSGLMSLRSQS